MSVCLSASAQRTFSVSMSQSWKRNFLKFCDVIVCDMLEKSKQKKLWWACFFYCLLWCLNMFLTVLPILFLLLSRLITFPHNDYVFYKYPPGKVEFPNKFFTYHLFVEMVNICCLPSHNIESIVSNGLGRSFIKYLTTRELCSNEGAEA